MSATHTRDRAAGIQGTRRRAFRRAAGLLPLLLVAVTGCGLLGHELRHLTGSSAQRLADDVTIERDEWGVPHVHGRSDAAAAFGLGYAMAEDNYWQIEEDMLFALGWASHYYGEAQLAHDVVRRAFDVERRARAEYEAEPAERRALWDAFASGLNHYLHTHPEAPRRLLARYEPWMLFARAAAFDAWTAAGTLRLGAMAGLAGVPPAAAGAAPLAAGGWGWAIAPDRSATGEALLLTAVQGPWFGGGQLYEAELRSDAGWHVAGVFELGLPLLRAGHNQRLAWLEVAAAAPAARLHRLVFDHPSDSLLFRTEGDWQRATIREDTVAVNSPAGVTRRLIRTTETPLGPVLQRQADTAFAAQLGEGVRAGSLQRTLALSRATTLEAFRSARSGIAGSRWNTLYADADGGIAVWADGNEERPAGGRLLLGPAPAPERLAPDSGWTVAALEEAAFDGFVPDAQPHIEALVDEWEMVGGSNPRRAFALDSAVSVLRAWDQRFHVSSGAALLYALWLEEYEGLGPDAAGWRRFRALEAALARLRREPSAVEGWGDLQRLQRRHTSGIQAFTDTVASLPFGAAPAATGAGFTAESRRDLGWRRYAVHGRAWTAVTRLSQPPRSRTVVPFGQSAHPRSAHFEDQAPRFAAGDLKELWFGGERLQSHVRERYHPGRRARVLQQ